MNRFYPKKNNKAKFMSEINVTPFVDVLLVLLIIFMVAAPMMTGAVDVDLPKGDTSKQIKDKDTPIVVSINKNGEIMVGDDKAKINDLKDKLLDLTKNDLNKKIYIRGDQAIDYGLIMGVIKKINESGFSKVILVTNISQ